MADSDQSSGKDTAGASLPELRLLRSAALRRSEESDHRAGEARMNAEAYSKAAEDLKRRAFELEAAARQFDVQGDAEEAKQHREGCNQLRLKMEENFHKADERGRQVMGYERESFEQRSLAARLTAQIKAQVSASGDAGPHSR